MDDWLISHIPGSGKKFATDAKRKSMKLSKAKIEKQTKKDYRCLWWCRCWWEGIGVEGLSMKKYLESITEYLHNMIKYLKKSIEQKIHLTTKPKFIPWRNSNEKWMMHTKSDLKNYDWQSYRWNQKLFDSLLHRYQPGLEKSMKARNFVFHYVQGLYYKCHK